MIPEGWASRCPRTPSHRLACDEVFRVGARVTEDNKDEGAPGIVHGAVMQARLGVVRVHGRRLLHPVQSGAGLAGEDAGSVDVLVALLVGFGVLVVTRVVGLFGEVSSTSVRCS